MSREHEEFLGFDHVDTRVPSLAAVEAFYDALMPLLGLPAKRKAYVDDDGEWHESRGENGYNAVEYYEPVRPGRTAYFIGFIEWPQTPPTLTRIAFRVARERLDELTRQLAALGARNVQPSGDMEQYPAIFFEDPAGTKLELVARNPAP